MTAIPTPSLGEIRANNPFPWRTALAGNGLVFVLDALGKEVPLFTLTRFCELTTAAMDANKPKGEPA